MSPDLDTARSLGSGRNPSLSKKFQGPHDLPSLIQDLRSSLDPEIDEALKKGGEEGLTDQVSLFVTMPHASCLMPHASCLMPNHAKVQDSAGIFHCRLYSDGLLPER